MFVVFPSLTAVWAAIVKDVLNHCCVFLHGADPNQFVLIAIAGGLQVYVRALLTMPPNPPHQSAPHATLGLLCWSRVLYLPL